METEKTFQSAQAGGQTEGAEVPTCGVASGADELLPSSRVHSTSVVPLTKECEATASVPAQQQVLSCRSCARSASWTGNTCFPCQRDSSISLHPICWSDAALHSRRKGTKSLSLEAPQRSLHDLCNLTGTILQDLAPIESMIILCRGLGLSQDSKGCCGPHKKTAGPWCACRRQQVS